MKLNKKWIALGLSTAMVIATISGCGDSKDSNENNAQETENSANTDAETTDAPEAGEETGSSNKKELDDLGGMDVKIGDWYSLDEEEPANQYAEDTYNYRQDIYNKYNFTVERKNISSWVDMPELFTTEVMREDPQVDIWYLYQSTVAEPLKNNLFYDLSKIKTIDFSEEKWNKQVTSLMSYKDGIYGMSTEKEPRAALFYNKRMFEEAGIDPEEPYELQKSGQWTWDKFEEYCKKLTKDTDNDGSVDSYALACFSKDFFKLCIASNGGQFVSKNDKGEFVNEIGTQNFIDGANWGCGLIDSGYLEPTPDGADTFWYRTAFRDGECAMMIDEVYGIGVFSGTMQDEFGCVMFPAGPQGDMMTVPFDNIIVIPSCFDDDYVEKLAFAYDKYTEPTPGYTLDDLWHEQYYPQFTDLRAVDETLALMMEEKHRVLDYQSMLTKTDYGDFAYPVFAGSKKPAEAIEAMMPAWDSAIAKANAR